MTVRILNTTRCEIFLITHDDVIKWKHFPRYWPFVRGIHRSPLNSPHKGQWRGALIFSLICVWINGWVNNREAGDLRRYRAHFDVTVMVLLHCNDSSFDVWQMITKFITHSHYGPVTALMPQYDFVRSIKWHYPSCKSITENISSNSVCFPT